VLFFILWRLRRKPAPDGALFCWYLILSGLSRFLVEFLRLNPRMAFGLSEAQLIAAVLILAGIFGMVRLLHQKEDLSAR